MIQSEMNRGLQYKYLPTHLLLLGADASPERVRPAAPLITACANTQQVKTGNTVR